MKTLIQRSVLVAAATLLGFHAAQDCSAQWDCWEFGVGPEDCEDRILDFDFTGEYVPPWADQECEVA